VKGMTIVLLDAQHAKAFYFLIERLQEWRRGFGMQDGPRVRIESDDVGTAPIARGKISLTGIAGKVFQRQHGKRRDLEMGKARDVSRRVAPPAHIGADQNAPATSTTTKASTTYFAFVGDCPGTGAAVGRPFCRYARRLDLRDKAVALRGSVSINCGWSAESVEHHATC